MRWFPISILIATGMHLFWAMGLLADPESRNATAIHALLLITDNTKLAAGVLIVVALMALVGAFLAQEPRALRAMLMLPQQGILVMSSISAATAMMSHAFADGIPRPFWFIAVDQIPVVMITAGYLFSLSRVILNEESRPDGR